MQCEYEGCKREAEVIYDNWYLCAHHHSMAEHLEYFQYGGIIGAFGSFLGLG